jgi:hypothetical protein
MFSLDALKKIQASDPAWEKMVPTEVARVIKEQRFLGYRPNGADSDTTAVHERRSPAGVR